MASDGCDRSRRMANRIAAAWTSDDRVCVLQFEQRLVGDMGSLCRGECIDRLAGLSFPHEPAGAQEKLEGEGKRAVSGLTVAIKILYEASSVHSQKYALKEDQRIGIGVKPPDNPKRIAEDEPPKSDHPPVRSLRTDKPRRGYRHHHGWPLHVIDMFQLDPPYLKTASTVVICGSLKPRLWAAWLPRKPHVFAVALFQSDYG